MSPKKMRKFLRVRKERKKKNAFDPCNLKKKNPNKSCLYFHYNLLQTEKSEDTPFANNDMFCSTLLCLHCKASPQNST